MDLREMVLRKVEELGSNAPDYFGKVEGTFKAWKLGQPIPLTAAQKVLDDMDGAITPVTATTFTADNTHAEAQHQAQVQTMAPLAAMIQSLEARVDRLENPNFNRVEAEETQIAPNQPPLQPLVPDEPDVSFVAPMAENIPLGADNVTHVVGAEPPHEQRIQPPTIPSSPGAWNIPHQKK